MNLIQLNCQHVRKDCHRPQQPKSVQTRKPASWRNEQSFDPLTLKALQRSAKKPATADHIESNHIGYLLGIVRHLIDVDSGPVNPQPRPWRAEVCVFRIPPANAEGWLLLLLNPKLCTTNHTCCPHAPKTSRVDRPYDTIIRQKAEGINIKAES